MGSGVWGSSPPAAPQAPGCASCAPSLPHLLPELWGGRGSPGQEASPAAQVGSWLCPGRWSRQPSMLEVTAKSQHKVSGWWREQ